MSAEIWGDLGRSGEVWGVTDREHGVESGAEVGGGARAAVDELLVAAYTHGSQG